MLGEAAQLTACAKITQRRPARRTKEDARAPHASLMMLGAVVQVARAVCYPLPVALTVRMRIRLTKIDGKPANLRTLSCLDGRQKSRRAPVGNLACR